VEKPRQQLIPAPRQRVTQKKSMPVLKRTRLEKKKKAPAPGEWLVVPERPMQICQEVKPQKKPTNTTNQYSLLGCDDHYDEEEPMQISGLTLTPFPSSTMSRMSCCISESKPKDDRQKKLGGADKATKPLSKWSRFLVKLIAYRTKHKKEEEMISPLQRTLKAIDMLEEEILEDREWAQEYENKVLHLAQKLKDPFKPKYKQFWTMFHHALKKWHETPRIPWRDKLQEYFNHKRAKELQEELGEPMDVDMATMKTTVQELADQIRALPKEQWWAIIQKLAPGSRTIDETQAWAQALQPHAMYISNWNALHIPFTFKSAQGTTNEHVLLDSGATENFLDHWMVEHLQLRTWKLPVTRKVHNVDGTENHSGTITDYTTLSIKKGEEEHCHQFYVTDLGKDWAIFRYPWLKSFNPPVNWAMGVVQGPPVTVETLLLKWIKKWTKKASEQIARVNFSQQWAEEAKCTEKARDTPTLPEKYQWHTVVFLEEVAKRFPPAWPEDHTIKMKPDAPDTINCKVYPLTKPEREATRKFIEENEALGFIEKTDSPWSMLWFFIKKKDGSLWPMQDYQEVNKWTIRDVYPIPWIKQILEQLEGKELFTALDIWWGYNNIHIKDEDRWKAAFKTPEGLYQPNVMFFGLMNSPATFQKVMDCIFQPLKNKYPGMIFIYMDDILITTIKDQALHEQIVHEVLELLEKESFFLKLTKCKFEQESIEYLGVMVENGMIRIDPTKQKGLEDWPWQLSTVKQVCSTLGILGYQRPFIPGFVKIARPLTNLLKTKTGPKDFKWTKECTKAVDKLISIVTSDPVLHQPNYDKPFVLEVDASQFAIGAILQQEGDNRKLHPIRYYLKVLTDMKRGYDVHDRELMAIVMVPRDHGSEWAQVLLVQHKY
jgi:RNase H-like domain found in reverse transcriptase/Reverse transcriptase (RNA-dependent DNA polymerase)